MNTYAHRAGGITTVLGLAHAYPHPITAVFLAAGAAALTSGGKTSPDIDNQPTAKTIDSLTPDELLGGGGPLGHRRAAHSWMIPAGAWWAWHDDAAIAPWAAAAVLTGAFLGWVSHLAFDAIWGKGGIPLLGWWWRVGVGLNNEGVTAKAATAILTLAVPWLAVTLLLHLPANPMSALEAIR